MIWAILTLLMLSYIGLNAYIYKIRRQLRHIVFVHVPVNALWFLGAMLDIQKRLVRLGEGKDATDVFCEYYKELECDVFVVPILRKNIVVCLRLEVMSRVLTDRATFYKTELFCKTFSKLGGTRIFGDHGMFNEPGTELWAAKRKVMDPAFSKAFLRTTIDDLNKVANSLIENIGNELNKDAIDITEYFIKSALEAVSMCGFAWDGDLLAKHGDSAINMTSVLLGMLSIKFNAGRNTFDLPGCWTKEKRQLKEAVNLMREVLRKHLKQRIESKELNQKDDILSYIIRANQVSDRLTLEDIVDEYLVFVTAGMETTAITMAVSLFYLTTHPDIYKKVQEEVDGVYGDDEELSFDEVGNLTYLEMVVKESLRLKPPARSTSRQVMRDGVVVDNMCLPKDTLLFFPYAQLHIDPRYWDEPLQFNPDRFSRSNKITNYTYMPFSAGVRNCVGKNFAMLEIKVIISRILHKYKIINPRPDIKDLPVVSKVATRPRDGIFIKIFPRTKLSTPL